MQAIETTAGFNEKGELKIDNSACWCSLQPRRCMVLSPATEAWA